MDKELEQLEITDNEFEIVEENIINSAPENEEKVYSKAEVDDLIAQLEDLSKYKPQELSDHEIKLQEKELLLWEKEISQSLKDEGLELFSDFIRVEIDDTESLRLQISKLKEIIGVLELSNTYQPTNHKNIDAYSIAKKNKDTKSMISSKLNF